MAKGLIGRHLNDYVPVFNTEGVWHGPRRETPRNDYCSWQADDKFHSPWALRESVRQCMYVCVCARPRAGLCVKCMSACVRLSGSVNVCATWPAGVWPEEFLTLSQCKAESVSHQTDYGAATMTAPNGKNRTPFNEHANLRNITLYSGI